MLTACVFRCDVMHVSSTEQGGPLIIKHITYVEVRRLAKLSQASVVVLTRKPHQL